MYIYYTNENQGLGIPRKVDTLVQRRPGNAGGPDRRLYCGTDEARNVLAARTNGSHFGTTQADYCWRPYPWSPCPGPIANSTTGAFPKCPK